jgi:hypothetical protein
VDEEELVRLAAPPPGAGAAAGVAGHGARRAERAGDVVVLVVIPVLVVGGWLVGVSPARWLLPCLAFTAGALALGEVVGLQRASTGLALGWAAVVVGPSLVTARPPVLPAAASLPGWTAAIVVVAMVLVVRRGAYTGLASGR